MENHKSLKVKNRAIAIAMTKFDFSYVYVITLYPGDLRVQGYENGLKKYIDLFVKNGYTYEFNEVNNFYELKKGLITITLT